MLLIAVHSIPQARPATTQDSSAMVSAGGVCIANSGPASAHSGRRKPATVHASATGSRQQDRRQRRAEHGEIGRAACRERVCQYVSISVVVVSLKTKHTTTNYE